LNAPARDKHFGNKLTTIDSMFRIIQIFLALITTFYALSADADVYNANNQAKSWGWSKQGVSIELTPLSPSQSMAFFIGRGFPLEQVSIIGLVCVFQGAIKNKSDSLVDYDLDQWQVSFQNHQVSILDREYWGAVWEKVGISKAVKVAFHWSLLPTKQYYAQGDYNWGMFIVGLKPGDVFDLNLTINRDQTPVNGEIQSMECGS
jgi:hypothetical protein